MHHAPSVSHPVGRSRFGVVAAALGWGMAVLSWGYLAWHGHEGLRNAGLGIGVLASCAALAWRSVWRAPSGMLHWDGADWWWMPAGRLESPQRVVLRVVLDFQGVLLLQARAAAGGEPLFRRLTMPLLWLERHAGPRSWQGLRRAVYSRAGHGAAGQSPAGEAAS